MLNNLRTERDRQKMSTDHCNKDGITKANDDLLPACHAPIGTSGRNLDYHKILKNITSDLTCDDNHDATISIRKPANDRLHFERC